MARVKYFLFMSALLGWAPGLASAATDSSMACELSPPKGEKIVLTAPIQEGLSEVKIDAEAPGAFELDASLSSTSFLFLLEDKQKHQRVAFTGSPLAVAPQNVSLSTAGAGLTCRRELGEGAILASRPAIQLPSYLMCVLDEMVITNGESKVTRQIVSQNSSHNFNLRQKIRGENEKYSFAIDYLSYDSVAGLNVRLLDKSTGESANFSGPGQTFVTSFILALTQGDRTKSGKLLRLGCTYSQDPDIFSKDP